MIRQVSFLFLYSTFELPCRIAEICHYITNTCHSLPINNCHFPSNGVSFAPMPLSKLILIDK